jgi:hypothetical protein
MAAVSTSIVTETRHHDQREHFAGDGGERIEHAAQCGIDEPAHGRCEQRQHRAHAAGQQGGHQRHAHRIARAFHHAHEHVAPEVVGAKPVGGAHGPEHIAVAVAAGDQVGRQQCRTDHRRQQPEQQHREADQAHCAKAAQHAPYPVARHRCRGW